MTLDATLDRLIAFRDALSEFIDLLRATADDEAEAEQTLAGLWEDSFRDQFVAKYDELAAPVATFTGEAEGLLEFLDDKITLIRGYLSGA
ncbi:hypothetical protein D0Z08_19550 [Nocardioides immobilis]|uniref:WXG100 family type VII secretion target n=1 Tax=Nocardioides immobilis TaxID=2049295 RepID=A0A417XYI2_9ACTN|nr:hypothetical protein [Nocardioides immobilis]RHW25424.1 hypothetical protein D0Z08_19550 [Nocardioides immobilis]